MINLFKLFVGKPKCKITSIILFNHHQIMLIFSEVTLSNLSKLISRCSNRQKKILGLGGGQIWSKWKISKNKSHLFYGWHLQFSGWVQNPKFVFYHTTLPLPKFHNNFCHFFALKWTFFSRVYGCNIGYPTSTVDSKDPLQGIHSRKLSKKSVKGTHPRILPIDLVQ